MMTFNVNVNITGLEGLTSILEKLVSVPPLNSISTTIPAQEVTQPQFVNATLMQAPPIQTYAQQAPPMELAPTVPLAPQLAPQLSYVTGQQPVSTVPIASQSYSMEQLAVAATQLVDADRRTELVAMLGAFGVQTLTALPKEQYGAFATQLRAMGAKI